MNFPWDWFLTLLELVKEYLWWPTNKSKSLFDTRCKRRLCPFRSYSAFSTLSNGTSNCILCLNLEEFPYCYTYHPCWDPLVNILHYIIYLKFALMPGSSWQLSLTSAATVATPHRLSNNPILWKKEIFFVKFWMRLVHYQ